MALSNQVNKKSLTARFMPLPNATRWNSWLEMAFYIHDYLEYVRGFYIEEKGIEASKPINSI
ncbi:17216_t:CDS:1, partial [Cetraspora pellucida]